MLLFEEANSPIRRSDEAFENTCIDPFAGEWEQITFWLLTNPERSSGDIFRELQRLSPGRYHPLHIRTHKPRDAEDTGLPARNLGGAMAGRSHSRTIASHILSAEGVARIA